MKTITKTNTTKIKVIAIIGDHKLVRFVDHCDSETQTNVKIIISLCLLILSNKDKKGKAKRWITKLKHKNIDYYFNFNWRGVIRSMKERLKICSA